MSLPPAQPEHMVSKKLKKNKNKKTPQLLCHCSLDSVGVWCPGHFSLPLLQIVCKNRSPNSIPSSNTHTKTIFRISASNKPTKTRSVRRVRPCYRWKSSPRSLNSRWAVVSAPLKRSPWFALHDMKGGCRWRSISDSRLLQVQVG